METKISVGCPMLMGFAEVDSSPQRVHTSPFRASNTKTKREKAERAPEKRQRGARAGFSGCPGRGIQGGFGWDSG